MLQTVFSGQTVFVVNDAPNWGRGFSSTFSVLRDQQQGLTKHEARRPYSSSLRLALKFSCAVSQGALRQLQGELRQVNTQPVIVPFWPAVEFWASRAGQAITGGLMLAWKPDWSQWALYATGDEPAWPEPHDLCAPAVWGFLKQNQPQMLNAQTAVWQVDFTEASPLDYALSVPDMALTAGPKPAGYAVAPSLLPFQPDYQNISEDLRVSVDRAPLGFEREQQPTFYPHEVYRAQSAQYTLTEDRLPALISWFRTVGGPGQSFWAIGAFIASVMLGPVAAADTRLSLDGSELQLGDWLAAVIGGNTYFAQLNEWYGEDDALMTGAFGIALAAGQPLFRLYLARLDKPELELTWKSPAVAQATLQWTEVRPEAAVAADEMLGTTLGKLPQRVTFFEFSRDLRNGTVLYWRYTSFEADINWGGNDWAHGPFTCGDLASTLNLEDDSCEIQSFIFPGNPLNDEVALASETPLSVSIWFAEYDGAAVSNAQLVFCGDVGNPSRDGNKIAAKCKFGPSIFETMLPRPLRGTVCNHLGGSNDGTFLISAGCSLLLADWKFTGLVAGPVSADYPFTLNISDLARTSGAAPSFFENWFANGRVEWGAGANIQRRAILQSTNPAGGALALTLHSFFSALPAVGDSLVIYPGCDGIYTTCKAYDAARNATGKFDNYANFGAEPFTPATNPSTTGLPQLGLSGAKK